MYFGDLRSEWDLVGFPCRLQSLHTLLSEPKRKAIGSVGKRNAD